MNAIFKTDEAAKLLNVHPQHLLDLIKVKMLKPAVPGGGRGRVHLFSAQQVLGLAMFLALTKSSRGCLVRYGVKILKYFESLDDAVLTKLSVTTPDVVLPWDNGEERRTRETVRKNWKRIERAISDKLKT